MAIALAEIGAEFVETALTFAPWLVEVPVLGRIIVALFPGAVGGDEAHAVREMVEQAKRRKTERKTRIDKNARYVLKASDAMQCVEDACGDGQFLVVIGKAIVGWIVGRSNAAVTDILTDRIFDCIESKTLRQDTPRVKKDRPYFARPARGHGRGR